MKFALGSGLGSLVLVGCFSEPPSVGEETDAGTGSTGSSPTSTSAMPTSTGTSGSGTGTSAPPTSGTTESSETESTGSLPGCVEGQCLVDIVVVVDNSGTMAIEQRQIGMAMLGLEEGLRQGGYDVHVMFTTTDFGNPLCTPFEPDGYDPAFGAPTTTACTQRLEDFVALGGMESVSEACTDACPQAVAPASHPYVAFGPGGTNVPAVGDLDVDGDGTADTPAAQALACLAPQGINGCGFESQLEAIVGALDPTQPWNAGGDPFLRDGSTVAVVLVTDEADCSMEDYAAMMDVDYQEIHPDSGQRGASSAICWNAGVVCSGGPGTYNDCTAATPTPLHPVSRYTSFLEDGLAGHEVVMLGVVGIPSVAEHMAASPYLPTAGGVLDLEYRDWIDGEYPAGDILPDDAANGVTAAHQHYLFGIGPGCTGGDAETGFTGQAIPPVRVREVCEALDVGTEPENRRCCLESVCDGDYAPAMRCLLGLVDNTFE